MQLTYTILTHPRSLLHSQTLRRSAMGREGCLIEWMRHLVSSLFLLLLPYRLVPVRGFLISSWRSQDAIPLHGDMETAQPCALPHTSPDLLPEHRQVGEADNGAQAKSCRLTRRSHRGLLTCQDRRGQDGHSNTNVQAWSFSCDKGALDSRTIRSGD